MAGKSSKRAARAALLACIALVLFAFIVIKASSEVDIQKYTALEKENISEESDDALREYYGKILGAVGGKARFNTISAKDDIAIINITVDGKDKRILTRLSRGVILPKSTDDIYTPYIQAENVTIAGNLKISGKEFFPVETSFGARNFFSTKSLSERLVEEGSSRLVDGAANVSINPIFAGVISGYNAYLSPSGLTKGIYVAEKAENYFIVKSANKKSSVAFSWLISGIRKAGDESPEDAEERILVAIDPESNTAEITVYNIEIKNAGNSNLITGNAVLEENLSAILDENPTPLPEIIKNDSQKEDNSGEDAKGNETADNGGQKPEGGKAKAAKFKIKSINEGYIISQVSAAAGMSEADVKKIVEFSYDSPEYGSDEGISESFPDGIVYEGGSVIIRLGS